MKFSSIIIILLCGSVITWVLTRSAFAATTNLSQIGGTVNSVKSQLQSTIVRIIQSQGAHKTIKKGSKPPEINASYLLGQGLAFTVAPIEFIIDPLETLSDRSLAHDQSVPDDHVPSSGQNLVASKQAAHRLKAKELAHSAHQLREQAKSLSKSIEDTQNPDKSALNEKLAEIRKEIKVVDQQRAMHTLSAPNETPPFQVVDNDNQALTYSASSLAAQFYQSLTQDIATSLCQRADDLKPLAINENITVLYQLSKTAAEVDLQARGWIVKNSDIQYCGKGAINSQQLQASAKTYQY